MKTLLLRVGIDNGTGGGLAPIYEDGTFDYVPIPEQYETTERRSFLDIDDALGNPLANHVDKKHRTDKLHLDPEFETYTYGDPTQKRFQLAKLTEDDLLVFYAGLQPEDYNDDPRLFVIGYFTVATSHDLKKMNQAERAELFERLKNNAHIKREETTPESKHPDKNAYPVIVEGKPDHSRLLEKARPLSDSFVPTTNSRYYMLDTVTEVTGYSSRKDLTRASGRWLNPDDPEAFRSWLDDGTVGLVDESTTLRTYVLKHDSGFAPNVSHGYCTLATCKPRIREHANVGDWVIGTGSLSKNDPEERLLYAMRIDEVLSYHEYFEDPRFEYKKPLEGRFYDENGDNIYYSEPPLDGDQIDEDDKRAYFEHQTPQGETVYYTDDSEFVQLKNPHHPHTRIPDDTPGEPADQAVLVSRQFWYFGEKEVLMPDNGILRRKFIKGYPGPHGKQGSKNETETEIITEFVRWLTENYRPGRHGRSRDAGEPDPDHNHTNC